MYEKSSEYLRDQGYCVKIFNLVSPENSDSWNCLSEVEGQELMAQLFVDVIIKNTINNGKGEMCIRDRYHPDGNYDRG